MSFQEKSAWICFVTILAVFGYYFLQVIQQTFFAADQPVNMFSLLMWMIVLQVVLNIVLFAVAAALAPRDAHTPRDERERQIALRAHSNGYWVLIISALVAAATIHIGADRIDMANAMLAAVVLAELVNYGSQIVLFRRDA